MVLNLTPRGLGTYLRRRLGSRRLHTKQRKPKMLSACAFSTSSANNAGCGSTIA